MASTRNYRKYKNKNKNNKKTNKKRVRRIKGGALFSNKAVEEVVKVGDVVDLLPYINGKVKLYDTTIDYVDKYKNLFYIVTAIYSKDKEKNNKNDDKSTLMSATQFLNRKVNEFKGKDEKMVCMICITPNKLQQIYKELFPRYTAKIDEINKNFEEAKKYCKNIIERIIGIIK